MTVVNFLCRREIATMEKKVKIATIGAVAVITSALLIMSSTQPLQESTVPDVRPVYKRQRISEPVAHEILSHKRS